jgi:hypothetical protein
MHSPRMASSALKRKREQHYELCVKVILGGNLARHYKTNHGEAERINDHKIRSNGEAKLLQCVSKWLDFCNVDLSTNGLLWLLDKLH